MDIFRWFWVQIICILGAFKKKSRQQTTKTETDLLRWIQPKHKWAWQDRSLEIHALYERISRMKHNSTLRTMVTYNDGFHHMYVWVGNVFVGFTTVDHKVTLFCAEGNDIQLHAEYEYAGYIDSVEKLTTKSHWSNIRSSMLKAFRAKLQRKLSIWQVACSNGIMLRRGYPVLAGLVHSAEEIRNFPDAANHGLRKLFAVGVTPAAACYQPLKKLLSGPLGRKLTVNQINSLATLRMEGLTALAAARNAGSFRKIIEKACQILGIPTFSTLNDLKSAIIMRDQHGFVWQDAVHVSAFSHWLIEYRNLTELGFQMPFTIQDLMRAWKEFRYFDFFRMGKIIDLTMRNTRGCEAFAEADKEAVESAVLEQCRVLLPGWHHAIIKAEHLMKLGKKMNFCVGYFENQVRSRSYIVVLSTKKGKKNKKPVTTGLVVRDGRLQFQQSHIASNACDENCNKMSDFKDVLVDAKKQGLTVTYPQNEEVLHLMETVLKRIFASAVYKKLSSEGLKDPGEFKLKVYAERKWFQRHLDHILKRCQELAETLAGGCFTKRLKKPVNIWPI